MINMLTAFMFYVIMSMIIALPSLCHLASHGIKEARILDILLIVLFVPGAILDGIIMMLIFIMQTIYDSDVIYKLKRVLNKKIFK